MTAAILALVLALSAAAPQDVDPARGESPPPDGPWRAYRLARCPEHPQLRGAARDAFDEALELFRFQNGGDAAAVLELAIADQGAHAWLLLLLAQIYLLAGQGEPHCLPAAGPLAPRGDWQDDRLRLLRRSDELLDRLERVWGDDGLVDFLRADAARARDDHDVAAEHDHRGRGKCTHLDSLELVRSLRDLRRRPARVVAPIEPAYPEDAARRRIQGEVQFDVLIDPFGRVAAMSQVGRADPQLAAAAAQALPDGGYQAALVGYYPVWSWLRVPIRFRLAK